MPDSVVFLPSYHEAIKDFSEEDLEKTRQKTKR